MICLSVYVLLSTECSVEEREQLEGKGVHPAFFLASLTFSFLLLLFSLLRLVCCFVFLSTPQGRVFEKLERTPWPRRWAPGWFRFQGLWPAARPGSPQPGGKFSCFVPIFKGQNYREFLNFPGKSVDRDSSLHLTGFPGNPCKNCRESLGFEFFRLSCTHF